MPLTKSAINPNASSISDSSQKRINQYLLFEIRTTYADKELRMSKLLIWTNIGSKLVFYDDSWL